LGDRPWPLVGRQHRGAGRRRRRGADRDPRRRVGPPRPQARQRDALAARAQGHRLRHRRRGRPHHHGHRFGTPGWLAPEQLAGQPGTPATDVYAWGLLIAWAASGQLPTATTTPDVSRVPQWLQPLVRAALSVDPARRPSARQLLLSLCGSDRPAKVQAATTPITWPLRQPGAAPPPALPPKGSDHLAAAYAKAGRRTRPLPLPTLVATRVEQRRGRAVPVAQPVRAPVRTP